MAGLMGWGAVEQGWRKGPWTPEEDKLLAEYISLHGEGRWSSVARSAGFSGLNRSGKSCRLRWVNYLRPGLKRSQITPQEEGIIIELHALWGNKWSTIARYLPGRTDNEIKNYWRTHLKKKEKSVHKHEKRKVQLINKKQQQQQQQQQQEEDIEKALPHAEAIDEPQMTEAQGRQEMVFRHPMATLEDQCFSVMYQDAASWSNTMGEDGLWGGLWNLDDHIGDCCKLEMQNQANAFSCGGDSNNLYNRGYNF